MKTSANARSKPVAADASVTKLRNSAVTYDQ
jgi:hypothetical protein